jgi:ketosteroid isomerase-like protein
MKKLIPLLLILAACSRPVPDQARMKAELIKTDKDFCQMNLEKGMKAAFTYFAAEEVIKIRDGRFPILGKQELIKNFATFPDDHIHLSWTPVKADVDDSLGYTFGQWQFRVDGKDTVEYGVYVTVWKKQPDGSWKYVLDGGNSTPKP